MAKPYVTVGKLKIKVWMFFIKLIRFMKFLHVFRKLIYSRREKLRILNKHRRLEKFKHKICLAEAQMKTKVFIFIFKLIHPVQLSLDVKFYKPTIQPKKMKIQNPFQESEEMPKAQELLIVLIIFLPA